MEMEMEKEKEMEQLLSMGFPYELASQALSATGGKSTVKATEWLLSHRPTSASASASASAANPNPPPPTTSPPPPSQSQPKLDRFFNFPTKPKPNPHAQTHIVNNNDDDDNNRVAQKGSRQDSASQIHSDPPNKRLKFSPSSSSSLSRNPSSVPLAERMRPRKMDEVVGQAHILGPSSLIGSAVTQKRLPSIVLWGPPGTGKTSIAKAIAGSVSELYRFVSLSAVTSGVKDVRDAVEEARKRRVMDGKRTVLFVDEVHRFNKSQQDSFLPVIEDGSIVFIGATTENPSFHLVTPLLSRCRVLTLNPLDPSAVSGLLKRAIDDPEKGLSQSIGMKVEADEKAIELLSSQCDGDARVALNALEVSATIAAKLHTQNPFSVINSNLVQNDGKSVVFVSVEHVKEALQCKHLAYDRAGEEHYNLISALHKSMRGSDANAALYWLARMLAGGEQPLYIARRLIRFASEDIGLADPNALLQAVACYQACHFVGMPECNVNLAQCVSYLALAPKSVSVYRAIESAMKAVRESVGGNEGVPLHLRNAPTKLMKELGYGKGYVYTPDNPMESQSFLPPSLQGYKFLDWPREDENGTSGTAQE